MVVLLGNVKDKSCKLHLNDKQKNTKRPGLVDGIGDGRPESKQTNSINPAFEPEQDDYILLQ